MSDATEKAKPRPVLRSSTRTASIAQILERAAELLGRRELEHLLRPEPREEGPEVDLLVPALLHEPDHVAQVLLVKGSPSAPTEKVGGSEPCPCGSGLKFKECHG